METYQHFKVNLKRISLLRIILCIRLAFGSYSNLSSSKIISYLMRFYCIVQNVSISIGLLSTGNLWSAFIVMENIICALHSHYTSEKFLFKFCSSIRTCDVIMGNTQYFPHFFITFTVTIVLRIIGAVLFGIVLSNVLSFFGLFSLICCTASIDLSHMSMNMILSVLYSRMSVLRKTCESRPVSVVIVGRNDVVDSIRHIRKCLYNYDRLLDSFQKINKEVQCLMTIVLLVAFPKMVMFIYFFLKSIIRGGGAFMMPLTVDLILIISQISTPAVFAELISYEVDNIKKILNMQLLQSSDACVHVELKLMLEYLRQRPFRCVIWRVVPLDVTLPVTFFTVTVTYVVAFLQLLK